MRLRYPFPPSEGDNYPEKIGIRARGEARRGEKPKIAFPVRIGPVSPAEGIGGWIER